MQQPCPSPLEPIQRVNKSEVCLFMDLRGEVHPAEPSHSSKLERIDLHLTLNFNKEGVKRWVQLPGGDTFEFGLNGGKLSLWLRNSNSPYEFRWLKSPPLETTIGIEIGEEEGKERQGSAELSTSGVKVTPGFKDSQKSTRTVRYSFAQVSSAGTEEEPIWIFEKARTDKTPVFIHTIQEKLATLNVVEKPCRIAAIFIISKHNLKLTDYGDRLKDLHPNRRKSIELGIIEKLEKELSPYMSLVVLRYGQ